jgi:acylglycerol lipase
LDDPEISHRYRRVHLRPRSSFASSAEYYDSTEIAHAEDVHLAPNELQRGVEQGGRWVFYIVFEMLKPPTGGWQEDGKGRGRDLMMVHGECPVCIN